MPRTDTLRGPTLLDTSRVPAAPAHCRLIYIGSPENGFVGAGRVFMLSDLTRVEFRRAKRRTLCATIEDGVLRISLPHPWVSGHHADLELGETVVLRDRDSRNGTLVEGDMIDHATLASGEVFEVGRCFWMLRQTRAPRSEEPKDALLPAAHPEYAASLHALKRLAPTRVPLLLVGETGTGKDHLARALHRATGRSGPFVRVNMMARSVEAQLFGEGDSLIDQARGGTLFLDDVAGLSLSEQSRLVSALLASVPIDADALELPEDGIRLIAGANTDLHRMTAEETFRPDLYGRLAGYECRIPALRDRREDLGLLAQALLRSAVGSSVSIKVDVFRTMLAQTWPFNVRELGHCLSAAAALREPDAPITAATWREVQWPSAGVPAPSRLASVRQTIIRELATHRGDKDAVAQSLKCEVSDIDRWLDRFDIEPAQFAS